MHARTQKTATHALLMTDPPDAASCPTSVLRHTGAQKGTRQPRPGQAPQEHLAHVPPTLLCCCRLARHLQDKQTCDTSHDTHARCTRVLLRHTSVPHVQASCGTLPGTGRSKQGSEMHAGLRPMRQERAVQCQAVCWHLAGTFVCQVCRRLGPLLTREQGNHRLLQEHSRLDRQQTPSSLLSWPVC